MSEFPFGANGRRRQRRLAPLLVKAVLIVIGAFIVWESLVTIVWDLQTEHMIDRAVTDSSDLEDDDEKEQAQEKIDEILHRDNPYSFWR